MTMNNILLHHRSFEEMRSIFYERLVASEFQEKLLSMPLGDIRANNSTQWLQNYHFRINWLRGQYANLIEDMPQVVKDSQEIDLINAFYSVVFQLEFGLVFYPGSLIVEKDQMLTNYELVLKFDPQIQRSSRNEVKTTFTYVNC
jgi:hypothetical protein